MTIVELWSVVFCSECICGKTRPLTDRHDRLTVVEGQPIMFRSAVVIVFLAIPLATRGADPASFDSFVKPFLTTYCVDCHGADTQESGVALHQLDGVTSENAEIWKSIWEQVALKEMPPQDGGDLPELMQRHSLSVWITDQLQNAMQSKGGFQAHLMPAKGNHLDHDLLFGELPKALNRHQHRLGCGEFTRKSIWPV